MMAIIVALNRRKGKSGDGGGDLTGYQVSWEDGSMSFLTPSYVVDLLNANRMCEREGRNGCMQMSASGRHIRARLGANEQVRSMMGKGKGKGEGRDK